jgi:hypothetical protein
MKDKYRVQTERPLHEPPWHELWIRTGDASFDTVMGSWTKAKVLRTKKALEEGRITLEEARKRGD